jgi:hypothetical protein
MSEKPIQTYTMEELRDFYQCGRVTFSKWLKPFRSELEAAGWKPRNRLLPPKIVALIFEKLGHP